MRQIIIAMILLGYASYYDEGVFEQVWDYRQHTYPACEECVGYAATENQADLGKRIWVSNGSEWVGPLHVIDVGNLDTPGRIVELDKWLADRWQMKGAIPVAITFQEPAIYRRLRRIQ